MIPAKELRIGSWVAKSNGKLTQIHSICGIYNCYNGDIYCGSWPDLDQITPISLTPGLLGECGITEDRIKYGYEIAGSIVLFEENGEYYVGSNDNEFGYESDNSIPIKYLHQLQNLFFALTGEELNVKL